MKLQQVTPQVCLSDIDYQRIDVRSTSEFASGHIPGAINIPLDELENRLDDIRKDRPAILICQSGKRAEMSARLLQDRGYDLHLLMGGMTEWERIGQPVICNRKNRWSLERQVRLGAGLIVLTGVILSLFLQPEWIYLSAFAGAGLTLAGLTNFCPMASILEHMPWNQCKR